MEEVKQIINQFDEEHVVKQVILIGLDGIVKNIEFEVTVK
jgi:hypothetical protein